jgi:teichoic acid transport system permease protein
MGKHRAIVSAVLSPAKALYSSRTLIWALSKNDFKTKYAGSYLGITWAFVQPLTTLLLFWFVFEFGLRAGQPVPDVPFILWLAAGLVPWFFFSDAVNNATNSLLEYSYLVKKMLFRISILPVIKVISALFVHAVFLLLLLLMYTLYGRFPFLFLQLLYYSFCAFCLALAVSYATASSIVFFRDLGQIIAIVLQTLMWMTPILWNYTMVPENYQWVVKLNPIFYIVNGYRETLIFHAWFWTRPWLTAYFWLVTSVLFILCARTFKKLKPHFADLL